MAEYYNSPQYSNGKKPTETVYSDRLFQWDTKKHDSLCQKHFGNSGQSWSSRTPEKIESFLSEYLNKPIELCRVEQLKKSIKWLSILEI
jgi:hypothetical protein